MSKAKTKVDLEIVLGCVQGIFSKDVNNLEAIMDGELSQAFFFAHQGKDYVIRVNDSRDGFNKDKLAYKRFNSDDIPIPKTLEIGELGDGLYFSVSERAEGKTLDKYSKNENIKLFPKFVKTLNAIHNFDVSDTSGYGRWGLDSQGAVSSWSAWLLEFMHSFSKDRSSSGELLDKGVVENGLKKYKSLIRHCPEVRSLVHADYGFNNAVSDGNKITGVLDWDHSLYGDFLYDVAWQSFWAPDMGYEEMFLKHYKENNTDVPNFSERVLCYKLRIGISSMEFFSRSEQRGSYKSTKDQVLKLISV